MSVLLAFCEKMATPAGFEPATFGLEIRCSIQLSYGANMDVDYLTLS